MSFVRLAMLAAVVTLVGAGQSRAQERAIFGQPTVVASGSMASYGALSGPVIYPYSYYAAPGPARRYVPYSGADTFPFYGRPYGHAYDRWSWSTFAGSNAAPARYFYEPLR